MRIPRIDDSNIQDREVFDISRGKLRSTCHYDPGDLRIAHINGLTLSLSTGGEFGGRLGSRLIKVKDATL